MYEMYSHPMQFLSRLLHFPVRFSRLYSSDHEVTIVSRPVFDPHVDTFDELHRRSPFAVDAICMVAAGVRDGGGKPSETYLRCLEEVQSISCATLFSPVTRFEAVQSMSMHQSLLS